MKKLLTLVMLMVLSVGYAWADGYYAVSGTETFPTDGTSSLSITSVEGVTMTFGLATDWKTDNAAITVNNHNYTKYATTNKTNPSPKNGNIPTAGAFVKFDVTVSGTLTVVVHNAGKDRTCYFIDADKNNLSGTLTNKNDENWASGNVLNSATAYSGGVKVEVEAGKSYYFYLDGSKMRFMGFDFVAEKPAAKDDATLKSITLDGTPLAGFDPEITEYNVELPYGTTKVPVFNYTKSNANATATTYQTAQVPGYVYINVTAEDGVTKKKYTINFTVAAASTNNELYQVVFSNSFDGFIKDGKVIAYYMVGTEKPTVSTIKTTHEKASAAVSEDGSKIVVTAENGDVAEYDVIVEAVEPYQGLQLTFDGTENWIKTGYTYDANKGWRFAKSVEEETNKRISQGNNRLYFFVDACTDITLYTATGSTSNRAIKVYRNGTELSTPTSLPKYAENANIKIAGDESTPCMIAVISNQTGGDGGVMSITVNKPAPAAVTLNASGYATYSNANTVTIEGATAYTAKVDEANSVLHLTELGTVIPAGQGVLLKGEAGATVTFTYGGEAPAIETNDFKAALLTDAPVEGNVFVLKSDKFVKYTGATLTKNKAYILMSDEFGTGSNARPMSIVFGGETNGITTVKSTTVADNAPTFNLNGQRVAEGTKGLLIKNGKKLIVK